MNSKKLLTYLPTNQLSQTVYAVSANVLNFDWNVYTVNSRYSGPLNCSHLDIVAAYLGTDHIHQDCTVLASDLQSPRYSVLQPLLETLISAMVFILHPEVMFVCVVMVKT